MNQPNHLRMFLDAGHAAEADQDADGRHHREDGMKCRGKVGPLVASQITEKQTSPNATAFNPVRSPSDSMGK
jgi:hypothetical protein